MPTSRDRSTVRRPRAGRTAGPLSLVAFGLLLWAAGSGQAAADEPRSVEELARIAKQSVVTIRYSGRRRGDEGLGTGFVVADGLVATNLHVIGEARPITVELADGTRHDVTAVHASDRAGDLAVVRIAAEGLVPLPLGDAAEIVAGQEVVAIGNPHGLERSVVTGRVSALREMDGIEMIQLALPVEPGNSGGPLLDRQGRVRGVVSLKSLVTPNLGFAVAVGRLARLLERPNPVAMSRWLTIGALDPTEWTTLGGARWRQRAGRMLVSGVGDGFGGRSLCLASREPPAEPFEIAVWVKLDDEAGAAGLVFAADGGHRHYGFYPTAGRLRLTRFDGPDVLSWKILDDRPHPHYRPGDWNHLRVRCDGRSITCFVNDVRVFESTDRGLTGGRVGLAKFRDTEAEFRGFVMGRDVPTARPAGEVSARVASLVETMPADGQPPRELIERLLAEGDAARAALVTSAADLGRRARHLEAVADRVHQALTVAAFTRLVDRDDADIDLFRAALLIAKLDNPDLDVEASVHDVGRLAAEVAKQLPPQADHDARLATLNRVLFDELGFHGSRGDYYNRSNSYVNEVLDDREGIPITLAVVYMEVARRLSLPMEGVGFPGHFLVRYAPAAGPPQWLDVFDRATPRTHAELALKLEAQSGTALAEEHLAVVGPRQILLRMLGNLLGIAGREGRSGDAMRYLDAILAIDPNSGRDRVMRMVTAYRMGRHDDALDDARWLVDHAPEGIDLEQVRSLRDRIEQGR